MANRRETDEERKKREEEQRINTRVFARLLGEECATEEARNYRRWKEHREKRQA